MTTKRQILRGIADYLETELIPGLAEDRGVQVLANTVLGLARSDVTIVDRLINHPWIKMLIREDEDGNIDLDPLLANLKESIEKYKYLPVTIPVVPFLTTTEKQIKFDLDDVQKLEKYLKRDC